MSLHLVQQEKAKVCTVPGTSPSKLARASGRNTERRRKSNQATVPETLNPLGKWICSFAEVFWDALLMTSSRTRPSFLSSWLPWVCRRPCSLCYLTLPWTSSLPFLPHSIPFRVSPTGQPVSIELNHAGNLVCHTIS